MHERNTRQSSRTINIPTWNNNVITFKNTGLFKMIVGVLTTSHTQYTWDSSKCFSLFNRTALQVFVTYVTGALYVQPLWFYKHQHDNRVRSMSVACQRWWFLISTFSSGIHTHPVSWNWAYHLGIELSDGSCFPNLVRNCRWTTVPWQSFWITLYLLSVNCSTMRWIT
jgi:hypothetical protein